MHATARYLFVFSFVLFLGAGTMGCSSLSSPSDKEIKDAISVYFKNGGDVKEKMIKVPPGTSLVGFLGQPLNCDATITELKILERGEKHERFLLSVKGTEVTPVRVYVKGTIRKRYGIDPTPNASISFLEDIKEGILPFEGKMDFSITYTPSHKINDFDSVPATLKAN